MGLENANKILNQVIEVLNQTISTYKIKEDKKSELKKVMEIER